MKFSIVSWHVPQEHGTATGRTIWATCTGLRSLGVEVDVHAWGWHPPVGPIPKWCTWQPLPPEPWVRMKARALVHPRSDVVRSGWSPAPGSVALAYEPTSFAAVEPYGASAVVMHYSTKLDARALGRRSLWNVQELRTERRAARRADVGLAYSDRVAEQLNGELRIVPIAYAPPEHSVTVTDEPVAAMLADWRWPPNQLALKWLLADWRRVTELVPNARLVLAGRGFTRSTVDLPPGVEAVGEFERSREILERTAVLAFPCPPTSGPKVKVLEAMSYGVPVVTTSWGAEGLSAAPGTDLIVADRARFADQLAALLGDHNRRLEMGARARRAVTSAHAPGPAAEALVAAVESACAING